MAAGVAPALLQAVVAGEEEVVVEEGLVDVEEEEEEGAEAEGLVAVEAAEDLEAEVVDLVVAAEAAAVSSAAPSTL